MWKMPGSGPPPKCGIFHIFFFDGFPYYVLCIHNIEYLVSRYIQSVSQQGLDILDWLQQRPQRGGGCLVQVLGRGLHPRLEEGAPELLNIRAEILHLHNM